MPVSSKKRAREWPYPRYRPYSDMLKNAAVAWFAHRNLHVRRTSRYILTKPNTWKDNIIVPEVAELIEQIRLERKKQGKGFSLHRYAYHGLSSKAMLFNLIGPLIVDDDQELLGIIFNSITSDWPEKSIEVDFEFEDRDVFNEDVGQPTSIDMILRNKDGTVGAIVESKFTETEFGGCSVFATGDCDGRNPSKDLKLLLSTLHWKKVLGINGQISILRWSNS